MPFKSKEEQQAYYNKNKQKMKDGNKRRRKDPAYKANERQKDKDRHYRNKYGLSMLERFGVDGQEGYNYVLDLQDHCCLLCGIHEDDIVQEYHHKTKTPIPKFVMDHCHESNEFRGAICKPCNTMLGGYEKALLMGKKIEDYRKLSLPEQAPKRSPNAPPTLPID